MKSFSTLVFFIASSLAAGPRPTCNTQVKVATTDLCSDIAEQWGTNVTTIVSINYPNATCAPTVDTDQICVRQRTIPCTLNETASSTTCDTFLTAYDLTEAQFVQLNDDVTECGNLTAGATYCVSNSDCFPGNDNALCSGHSGRK